uniref:Uncharacterized protein n=1 Tax=Amphora coffeiformis TaxID=265554 RepID=A0A7S3P406_9STRA|mmetsp:Transcript_5374/g.10677  ORF Transcript_5374/g.10677 Transcript_5374/m.10677 type:complete len:402 (-) Transcript_5374:100-1305(-)|eukprot:scaffold10312_cov149-Amphora_coffeaeformis.AAC.7
MSVDVDAVNERLNGLVTLLKAVGVDSLGDKDMSKAGGLGGLPNAQQLDDDQIEAIIKKLQQAQAEAPQIIAALEAHAEARSLTGSQNGKARRQPPQRQPEPEPEPEEDDDEDDDEFDEDANYPMVGHGVSDDISVVSDLTTPTVLQGVDVPEEEHYRDTLPPMIVGGGPNHAPAMIIAAPKTKNRVGQVRPGVGPPRRGPPQQRGPGGAAAARRNKYQQTIAKLGPDAEEEHQPARRLKPKQRPTGSGQPVRKKKPASSHHHHHSELGGPRQNELASDSWNAFENKPRVPNKAPTVIDNDGFLTAEGFDPFGVDQNPFKSSAGDLEFGSAGPRFSSNASASGFESFEGGKSNPRRVKKKAPSMQSNFSSAPERKVRPAGSSGVSGGSGRPRPRARRASLAM